jgi:hypothetical protein
MTFLDHDDDDDPVISREVAMVLVSEDFSQEITTTVLWLNEFHAFDIRCIRLSPYTLENRILLDVQQVIPLPEANDYTIRVREKEHAERQVRAGINHDRTKFVVQTPTAATEPLPKRWAMLRLVEELVAAGVAVEAIRSVLPPSKTLVLPDVYADADELWSAILAADPQRSDTTRTRWHLEDPIEIDRGTLIVANQWGTKTREFFEQLLELAPVGFAIHEEDGKPIGPTPRVDEVPVVHRASG